MKITKNNNHIEIEFDGIEDLISYLRANLRPGSKSLNEDNYEFCKWTYREAIKLLEEGWIDGITQMDVLTQEIECSGDHEQVYIKYDTHGDFFNVGRFLSGEPECCGQFKKRQIKNSEVNIMCHITASGGVSQESMIKRGAVIQALIDKLHDTHYVNLQLIEYTTGCMNYDIKMILNVDTRNFYSREAIAFCVGNPAFLRKICFAVDEILVGADNCHGYGHVKDVPERERKGVDVYFPPISYDNQDQYSTIESSKAFIEQIISDLNGKETAEREPAYDTTNYTRPPAVSGAYSGR